MISLLRWLLLSSCERLGHRWGTPERCGVTCTMAPCLRLGCRAAKHYPNVALLNRHMERADELLAGLKERKL